MQEDNRNFFLFIAVSLLIFLTYDLLFVAPKRQAEQERQRTAAEEPVTVDPAVPSLENDRTAAPTEPLTAVPQTRSQALGDGARLGIDTPKLSGSIAMGGGRFDDLVLQRYQTSIEEGADNVTLLEPRGTAGAYFANLGWAAVGTDQVMPDETSGWTGTGTLTPQTPVTLRWSNGTGLTFVRTISVDEDYLFTVTQTVENGTDRPLALAPFALISRRGKPETSGFFILHEGPIGVFDDSLKEVGYGALEDDGPIETSSNGGWLGITDKYWLVAIAPENGDEMKARFVHTGRAGVDRYQADFTRPAMTVPAGGEVSATTHLFAGAKEVDVLRRYETELEITGFDKAVDWGWFFFLTRPIFWLLHNIQLLVGNFGVSILLLTVVVKLAFFPLANKSYESMGRMKELQPKMKVLQERYKDDRQKLSQEMMALYQKEKVNPAAGCLPILLQIPVFFALYKVLFVTLEMRHQPFFGWIQDLSAPDPATLLTLFGWVPWEVPALLSLVNVGIWPIVMGVSMYLQYKLNPTPTDPIQQKIFLFMPIVMTFILAPFPAGLVIYWTWNTLLSALQQWIIMRRAHQKAVAKQGA